MITMVDEIFDRNYQAGRDALNASIISALGSVSHAVGNAFKVLNKIEYDAPWMAKAETRSVQLSQRRGARTSTHRAPRL